MRWDKNIFLHRGENIFQEDEPIQQMQYTMLVEKVMNLYVYWSVSTVKQFDCRSDGRGYRPSISDVV
ncbi:hypothetical protein B9T25_09870 [Acinetobacter sp. ANC 4470]|nr:hypothetical protein B9T25_09870 [Acinetobacter sp. ANC 4470]